MIHLIWLQDRKDPPRALDSVVESWKDMHPGTEVVLWQDIPVELAEEYDDLVDEAPNLHSISDLIRYWLLWKHGGIYADIDCAPLRPCLGLLEAHADFVAHLSQRPTIFDNYFMGTVSPGRAVWKETLDRCRTHRYHGRLDVMPYNFRLIWEEACPVDTVETACPEIVTNNEYVLHSPTWQPRQPSVRYADPPEQPPLITEEEERIRIDMCAKCEYLMDNGVCKKCGCSGRNRSRIATVHCPVNKW